VPPHATQPASENAGKEIARQHLQQLSFGHDWQQPTDELR